MSRSMTGAVREHSSETVGEHSSRSAGLGAAA